uniref:Uncharacterized protein n=1 Tax=Ciona savignyi TaxID=51511 RepID=H2Z6G7_CIOSA
MTSRRKQVAPCKVREFAASSECEMIENGRGYPMKATDWKNSIIGAELPDESRP